MAFTHFHVHTEFSTLDGMARLDELVAAAVADGQDTLAITDHGTLAGTYRFRKACVEAGIKPVLGIEAYMAIGDNRFEPQVETVAADDETVLDGDDDSGATKNKHYHHLTVLAATAEGWSNLCRMHAASQKSFHKKPLIDWKLLTTHGAGLIALTGCLGGPVAGPASRGDVDGARENLGRLVDALGHDNVFVEVMEHGIPAERAASEVLVELAREFDLPLVATNDSHYTDHEDCDTHGFWLDMQAKGFAFHGEGYHLRTEDEMRALCEADWWAEACDNTKIVADMIADDVLPPKKTRLSKFALPEGFANAQDYLHELTRQGVKRRYEGMNAELKTRLRWEEDVIGGHHGTPDYSDYFLIVRDLVAHAREVGGIVGPGRGSGAGSATAFVNEITDVEPLGNNLLFERFMEPGRVEFPDFDIDFQPSRRPELIRYVQGKYGFDKVARIGSFGTTKSPGALKAAAEALDVKSLADKLVPTIPKRHNIPIPLAELMDEGEEDGKDFRATVDRLGEAATEVVDLAIEIEGIVRALGIHACGVLLSDEDLPGLIPLRRDRRAVKEGAKEPECWVSEWDADDVQDYGMLKLDFLTLDNLDVIAYALSVIEDSTGDAMTFGDLPQPDDFDDPRVQAAYRLMQKGRTVGLFQIEDDGMQSLCREMQPENLDDLSAISALYRPGPLSNNMHTRYVERKAGREQVTYRDWTSDPTETEWLDKVLGRTYGIFAFQEQLMQLGEVVAGFDAPLRSKLRKAVSKKKKELMDEVGALFMAGAESEHYDPETNELISPVFRRQTAERLWESMAKSADYLFNACLTGDTALVNGTGIGWTIEDLYHRLHGVDDVADGTCKWCGERPATKGRACGSCASWRSMFSAPSRGFCLMAWDDTDDRLRPQRVKDVHRNGVKPVFKITLADGRSVKATDNHRFLTPGGWVHVRDMEIGTALHVEGGYEDQVSGPERRTTVGDHKRHDYRENQRRRRWGKGHLMATSPVVSIEPCGEQMTYDVEMATGTTHSFTANGIVSHNSHSAAYGMITFATAVLKANWPAEYGAAVISLNKKAEKRQAMIRDLLRSGVEVLPPDLNRSGVDTTVVDQPDGSKAVIFGLGKVRSVSGSAGAIVAEREANGEFSSVRDVMERVTSEGRRITTLVMDSLIAAGACDAWGNRAGQMAIVRASDPETPPFDWEWGVLERSVRQRHALSVALNEEHPMTVFAEHLSQWQPPGTPTNDGFRAARPTALSKVGSGLESGEQRPFYTLALLDGWERKPYSGGRYRAQVTLSDADGTKEGVIWHDDLEVITRSGVPSIGTVVALQGRAKTRVVQLRNDDDTGEEGEFVETVQLTITSMIEVQVPDRASMPDTVTGLVSLDKVRARFTDPGPDTDPPRPPDPGPETRSKKPKDDSGALPKPKPKTTEAVRQDDHDEPVTERPAAKATPESEGAQVIPLRRPQTTDESVYVVACAPGSSPLYGVTRAGVMLAEVGKALSKVGRSLATQFPPPDAEDGSVWRTKIKNVTLILVVDSDTNRRTTLPDDVYDICLTLNDNDAVWTADEDTRWEQAAESWVRQVRRIGVS